MHVDRDEIAPRVAFFIGDGPDMPARQVEIRDAPLTEGLVEHLERVERQRETPAISFVGGLLASPQPQERAAPGRRRRRRHLSGLSLTERGGYLQGLRCVLVSFDVNADPTPLASDGNRDQTHCAAEIEVDLPARDRVPDVRLPVRRQIERERGWFDAQMVA